LLHHQGASRTHAPCTKINVGKEVLLVRKMSGHAALVHVAATLMKGLPA
jgi:hypothetical protein